MTAAITVDYPVTGKTLDDLATNADAAAAELANGRSYEVTAVRHAHGSFEPNLKKGEPPRPGSFTAQATARIDGPPDTFTGDEQDGRAVAW